MTQIFEKVQTEFMTLNNLLDTLDFKKDMQGMATFEKVYDALCNTYIVLNQGFCETMLACQKCSDNRNELEALIRFMDEADDEEQKEKLYTDLENFKSNIPNILINMESMYIESLEKVH